MTLNKREKILAVAVGALLAALAIYFMWPAPGESLADLRANLENKQRESEQKKNQALRAKKATELLAAWKRQALPEEAETAQSLYQTWLRNLVKSADFSNVKFNALPTQPLRDMSAGRTANAKSNTALQANIYTRFLFNIQCQGTLEKLTRFLYEFYSAGHLHKISALNIAPVKNSSELELNITVEAMSLPGSAQKDKLSAEPGKRLKLASLDDYKKAIVGRNLFASCSAKPADNTAKEESKPDAKVDPLQFSYLTAIIEADGIPQAWLFERTTGETFKLHEGEEFTIGKVHGKVSRIGYNEIEIEIDGQSHTVGYGNNLKM